MASIPKSANLGIEIPKSIFPKILEFPEILEFQTSALLESQNLGILEIPGSRKRGMLKAWNPARWGSRSPRSSESLNPQIPRSWNPRIRESWNPIILKSWNNLGILESQNLNNPGILIQQIPYSYIVMYLIRMILESMKPGPDFKTRTGIFLQPGPEYPDRKKLRTGPYSITRTGIETRTGMDRTGKN